MQGINKGRLLFLSAFVALFFTASLLSKGVKLFTAPQSAAAGQQIEVVYAKPMKNSPKGDRYWITITHAGAADAEWGAWVYVEDGATSTTLSAPTEPGQYEIRLHDYYPKKPYHILQREPLTVE
jgi:hypothetical protein